MDVWFNMSFLPLESDDEFNIDEEIKNGKSQLYGMGVFAFTGGMAINS